MIKQLFLTTLLTLGVFSAAASLQAMTPTGMSQVPLFAEGELWTDVDTEGDWSELLARAKKENKLLLVDFTGSDWCGWCIKLKNEVFNTETFIAGAPKDFLLVEIDFPKKTPPAPEVQSYRKSLAKMFGVRGYPSILLIDGDGNQVAKTGYKAGGPENYLTHLGELKGDHIEYMDLKSKAEAGDKASQEALAKLEKEKDLKKLLASANRSNQGEIAEQLLDKYIAGDRLDGENADFRYYAMMLQGAINRKNLALFDELRKHVEACGESNPKIKMILDQMKLDDVRLKITSESAGG